MGIISMASSSSAWRGLDYYKNKKVVNIVKVSDNEYDGIVLGSNENKYNVHLNSEHPRNSMCDCPLANGKKIICKHIVALYFTVFPNEAQKFIDDMDKAQEEYEEYKNKIYNKTMKFIDRMSKSELQESLKELLSDAPDWVYDRFVRDHVGE
jgi:uncharacterized Zn finger protein